jgi:hypothetical protein
MTDREFPENRFAARGDFQKDMTPVLAALPLANESVADQPLGQFNSAVVPDVQSLGDFADVGLHALRETFQCQQQLMLLRIKARIHGRLLAEMQKPANLIAEFREGPEIVVGQLIGRHRQIISYYDVFWKRV